MTIPSKFYSYPHKPFIGPYFYYSASGSVRNPNTQKWPNVPDVVNDIRDMIVRHARWYAGLDKKGLEISRLDILAWVSEGKRKVQIAIFLSQSNPNQPSFQGNAPINAKEKAVVLVLLGCNMVLTVVPRSLKGTSSKAKNHIEDHEDILTAKDDKLEENSAGWIGKSDDVDEELPLPEPSLASPKKKAASSNKDAYSLVFSLVHGDALVLFGDEFEVCFIQVPTRQTHEVHSTISNEREPHFVSLFSHSGCANSLPIYTQ